MRETLCPYCGRPYPPILSVSGPVRRRIVDVIASRPNGITRPQLIQAVYGGDPNGGPLHGNVVSVLVHHANRQLRPQGYEITASRGRGGLYRLVRTHADSKLEPARHNDFGPVEGNQPADPAWFY
jgi:hypothetical protein